MKSIADSIKEVVALAEISEGDVKFKATPPPNIKPPRKQLQLENESNKSDYMKNYMTDYRENGKDYQKMPDKVKQFRREQKKKFKNNLS